MQTDHLEGCGTATETVGGGIRIAVSTFPPRLVQFGEMPLSLGGKPCEHAGHLIPSDQIKAAFQFADTEVRIRHWCAGRLKPPPLAG